MNGRLTTHVLDLSEGKPAAGMRVQLYSLSEKGIAMLLEDTFTNHDGRLEHPLLEGEALRTGMYELVFWAGEYFVTRVNSYEGQNMFLDLIPVRFKVIDPTANYHVPLLAAPGGYSTYRGS